LLVGPVLACAHHSVALYDASRIVDLEGTVTAVSWTNPHVRFSIVGTDATGAVEKTWAVEMTSISTLRRRKLEAGFVKVGDKVRAAGNPARDGSAVLYARNILLPTREEVILETSGKVQWPGINSGVRGTSQDKRPGDPSSPQLGIFRVWSTPIQGGSMWKTSYPLTPAAKAAVAAFNPVTNSVTVSCSPKGMPTIMQQPYPVQFVQQGARIVVRIEEYDTVRNIDLSGKVAAGIARASLLGSSVGRWEGRTLVVRTTGVSWKHFDRDGVPLSAVAEMVEYFTVSEDGSRLDYRIVTTDPATFTEPVTLEKYWLWYPEATVEPYRCKS